MSSFTIVLGAALPVYLMAVAGFACRRLGVLTAEADQSLMRLTVNLFTPCLILNSLLKNPVATDWRNLLAAPVAGFLNVAVGFAVSYLVGCRLRLPSGGARTFGFSVGLFNFAYLALPLVAELFGQHALGVLFLHNLGVEVALWTLGIALLSGSSRAEAWKQLLSPPVLAVIIGVCLSVSGAGSLLPAFLTRTLQFLGLCAFPIGLILTGAIVFDFSRQVDLREQTSAVAAAVILRMLALPAGMLLAARFLPISLELAQVIVVMAAMPAGMGAVLLSKLYGGETKLALRIVIVTSLLSFATIPPMIGIGLRLIKKAFGV